MDTQKAIAAELENLGLAHLTLGEYVFTKKINEVLKCVELFEDDESAEVYTEIIESYVAGWFPSSKKFVRGEQYFILPEFLGEMQKEVFVDCGAYVGDTIEKYISVRAGMFGNIFAFEPDNINYRAMQYRLERLNREWALSPDKIKIVEAGVGSKTTAGMLNNQIRNGSTVSEKVDSTVDGIKIYALDDFFADQRIDFLKADIEGSEWNMLHGAEKVIRRDLPKMAICIYHSPSDMYRILLWIDSLNLGYKFSVRHHSIGHVDMVLYAYH